jgi:hypothetical protein
MEKLAETTEGIQHLISVCPAVMSPRAMAIRKSRSQSFCYDAAGKYGSIFLYGKIHAFQ